MRCCRGQGTGVADPGYLGTDATAADEVSGSSVGCLDSVGRKGLGTCALGRSPETDVGLGASLFSLPIPASGGGRTNDGDRRCLRGFAAGAEWNSLRRLDSLPRAPRSSGSPPSTEGVGIPGRWADHGRTNALLTAYRPCVQRLFGKARPPDGFEVTHHATPRKD